MPDMYDDYWSDGPWGDLHPEDAADAFAAAGVLSAAGAEDPRDLWGIVRHAQPGELASPLLSWQDPREDWLLNLGPSWLADNWREGVQELGGLRVSPDFIRDDDPLAQGRPRTLRLWVKAVRFREAARRLSGVTVPEGARLVLTGGKSPRTGQPVPRWTWPLVVGFDSRAPRMAELLLDQPSWLRDLVRFVDLADPATRCSLAVLPAAWPGALVDRYDRSRAAAALVLGGARPNWPMMLGEELRFDRVAAAAWLTDESPRVLVELVRHLSHDVALDEALAFAAARRGIGYELYSERPFLDRTRLRRMLRDRAVEREPTAGLSEDYAYRRFYQESGDATSVAEALTVFEREMALTEQRFLKADARPADAAADPSSTMADVGVWIGPGDIEVGQAGVPFEEPDEWDGDQVELTVVLIPFDEEAEPQTAPLVLPRTGESPRAEFRVRMTEAEPWLARVALIRRNRFIQTALLSVNAVLTIDLQHETSVRPLTQDLLDLIPADLALVHNHDAQGRPIVTTVGPAGVRSVVPTELSGRLEGFRQVLERVADDPESYAANENGFEEIVVELARRGSDYYRLLFGGRSTRVPEAETRALAGADVIAVLSVIAGDVLPLEFVYDFDLDLVREGEGRLCENNREAAAAGRCCGLERDRQTVCPFGFWGVRKVIERHIGREGTEVPEAESGHVLVAMPTLIDQICELRSVLAGASAEADSGPGKEWTTASQDLSRRLGGDIRFAHGWDEWCHQIEDEASDILLLLPHVDGPPGAPFLQLGLDDRIDLYASLDRFVVHRSWPPRRAPIVLLLGCATASGAPINEFPSKFFDAKARLVVGTLTAMLGRYVAPLSVDITLAILDGTSKRGVQAGELLRYLRRRAFETRDPAALSLVAFGDSSLLIKAR